MMRVTYLGHSGFLLEMEDALLLFDYYQGSLPEMDPEKTLFVFVSHVHYDHYNPDILKLRRQRQNIWYLFSDDVPMPEHEFVTLPPRTVTGIENSCSHRLEDWATACTHMRQEFWLHHISVAKTIPDYVYGLYSTTRNPDKEDEQTVHYTTAVAKEFAAFTTEENVHEVEMPGGEYLCFTFSGIPYRGAMQEFLFTIYGQCVPRLGITRRRGYDIESYKLRKGTDIRYPDAADVDETDPRHHIEEFKYYIPVRRDAQ